MISIIIPASNEENYIGACLEHLLASWAPSPIEVIVVANGCMDDTVIRAREASAAFAMQGWPFTVLDLAEGSKIMALNAGDQAARYQTRAYIDADILVAPDLIAQIMQVLDRADPTYASGQPVVPAARSLISRRYARFWEQLPFIREGVPGCGVFAVNAAGRARWDLFPDIISDDTFVRFHFSQDEMQGVPATFQWPITEGFSNLVRVRRRQDEGLAEMRKLYPELARQMASTTPATYEKLRLLAKDPIGFVIYSTVALAVRTPLFRNRSGWDRGR